MEVVINPQFDTKMILWIFISLRLAQLAIERTLATLNRQYYSSASRQQAASDLLGIGSDEMQRTLTYSNDKYFFARIAGTISLAGTLFFLAAGGFGWLERSAQSLSLALNGGELITGLCFFALLGLVSSLFGLPFDYYRTFVLEQKHGFNRQTPKGFWLDRVKGLGIALILGAPLLSLILWPVLVGLCLGCNEWF